MSHFTGHQATDEAIDETLQRALFRIDRFVQKMGYDPLSPDELRQMYGFATEQTRIALAKTTRRDPPAVRPSPKPQMPLPSGTTLPPGTTMADFAEGGLINDSSGEATRRIRRQFGIREGR